MAEDKLVYSSKQGSTAKNQATKPSHAPAPGPAKIRLETKGRGGKAVTVLWNLPFSEQEIKALVKDLQQKSACGATIKNAQAEFQGDIREAAQAYFQAQGWKLVPSGG